MEYKRLNDLAFISALMTLGYMPTERSKEGNKVYFTFEWDENMADLENKFFTSGLSGDMFTYSNTLKAVKQSIFQMQNN